MRNFYRKSEIVSVRIENFLDRIHEPPDLKTDWRHWWEAYHDTHVLFFTEAHDAQPNPCGSLSHAVIASTLP